MVVFLQLAGLDDAIETDVSVSRPHRDNFTSKDALADALLRGIWAQSGYAPYLKNYCVEWSTASRDWFSRYP